MRIPIATKLALPTVLLVASTALIISIQNSNLFENTSMQRENDINISEAMARGTEVEQVVLGLIDKVHMFGSFAMNQTEIYDKPDSKMSSFHEIFKRDRDIVSLEIAKVDENIYDLKERHIRDDYLKAYGIEKEAFLESRSQRPISWLAIKAGNIEVKNSSGVGLAPLFSVGVPIVKNEFGMVTHIAIADIRLSRLQKSFSQHSARTVFLVDRDGRALAHTFENYSTDATNFSDHKILKAAKNSEFRTGQSRFVDQNSGEAFIGAFTKLNFGLVLVSEIKESIILEPSQQLRRDSYYIAGILISAALLLILLGSLRLTLPLERLVSLTKEIASGNFDVGAQYKIHSKDEVGDLARSFDEMALGLKERDKVKNLFNKFHGSQVTEDLINKDISLGGVKKEVTVFFSDIRGFTSFSENHPPEEVVELLNAYFGVMVEIINRHGGIVDKFIGDAIMAVWGAPHSSDDDAHRALFACLEMRRALHSFNENLIRQGREPIFIGMGLHSGQAISGTIGSDERMEYTVIGDTVNVASRIEAATKSLGTDLLISDATLARVGNTFTTEFASQVEVKGKSEALTLFKVRGYYDHKGELITLKTPYSDYMAGSDSKVKIA